MVEASSLYQIEARVSAALRDRTPRQHIHAMFAPQPRRGWQAGVIPSGSRVAAALVLLYPIDQQVHIVLTRRASTLGQHAGQISLPGGAVDGEETIEAAALREAREEIGLSTNHLRTLGALSALYIPVSNFTLHPIVSILDQRPQLKAATNEVAHILEVPLDELCNPTRRRKGLRWRDNELIDVPYFEFQGERVWGATAMVLGELAYLLEKNLLAPE